MPTCTKLALRMPLNDPDDPFDSLVYLSPDGKLERPAQPTDQRRPPESWTPPVPPPLELNHAGYAAPAEPAVPDEAELALAARLRQRQQLAIGAAAIVLLFAAAAFFLLRPAAASLPETPVSASAPGAAAASSTPAAPADSAPVQISPAEGAAAFTVQSDPPGATVLIGDEILGTTPFLGTNDIAPGQQAKIRLELRGYADWTGSVAGGRNVNLLAHLKRK